LQIVNGTIKNLKDAVSDDPDLPAKVASWEYRAFGGRKQDERENHFRTLLRGRRDRSRWGVIEVLVAFGSSGKVVGSACLLRDDMAWCRGRHGLTPWLSSLFVLPGHRHQGFGRLLVESMAAEAACRGYQELFLYVDADSRYGPRLVGRYERWGFESFSEYGGLLVLRRLLRVVDEDASGKHSGNI
jgi:GNAT superfamily N-acetyltransferase